MPPKASVRRPPRVASREPDNMPSAQSGGPATFQKPKLPLLQGTPSSRRQYSYGAAAEPPPARPGRGLLQGQVLDLSTAVRNAMIRDEEEELYDDDPPPSRMPSQSVDPNENDDEPADGSEVASDTGARRTIGRFQAFRNSLLGGQVANDSEADDARSFGIESDYYGDATIASTPGAMPPPQSRPARPGQPHQLQGLSDEASSESQYEPETSASTSRSSKPAAEQRQGRNKGIVGESEEDRDVKPIVLGHAGHTNTPAPKRVTTRANRAAPASPPESEAMTRRQDQSHDPVPTTAAELKSTKMRRGRQAGGKRSLAVGKTRGRGPEVSDSGHGSDSESGRGLGRATGATTASDTAAHLPASSFSQDGRTDDERLDTVGSGIDWSQLVNPWTYVKATAWIVEAIGSWAAGLFDSVFSARTRHRLLSAFHSLPYIIAGMVALVMGLALSSAAIATFKGNSTADDLWQPQASGASWLSMGGITSKIGGYLPTISWSSRSRWDGFADLWEADDALEGKIDGFLKKMETAFQALESTDKLHEASLKKLETVVPKVVHMQLKDGKPRVALDFWHALRDLIRDDGAFLMLESKGSGEQQWKAIAARLAGDPAFTSKLNSTVGEVEGRLGNRIAGFWATWVKENDARIEQSLGSAVDQIKSAASQRELDDRLGKIVQAQLQDRERQGLVVGRDEFLQHVKQEFAAHRSEIRAELGELQPRLEKLVRESVDLATRDAPASVSRAEVTSLVNGLVRKAFADVGLEAMARGKIHVHWDTELKNQINYFSVGAGAIVDAQHTGATWQPPEPRSLLQTPPPIEALGPWQDEGECWCAARSRNRRGNPHGAALAVQLGHRIVPQHLVLEHMLPGATTDPGARPRDVEVYADVPEPDVRQRALDYSAVYFPDDSDDWNHTPPDFPESFVMIGRFVYDGAELHDGVYVYRFSDELMHMRAATDHVIVRAVSNYGAKDHTCFYRVRLYGRNVDLDGYDVGGEA